MSQCKVIAVENQKGGTGKSTTVLNLGVGLVRHGKKVMLIDADPQGSLSISLGIARPDDLDITLATVMTNIMNDREFNDDFGIIHCDEGVDLMPCNIELSGVESNMFSAMSREFILKAYVDQQRKEENTRDGSLCFDRLLFRRLITKNPVLRNGIFLSVARRVAYHNTLCGIHLIIML